MDGKHAAMSLKHVLLGLLTRQDHYGYQLKPEAERLLGGADLNPGQLYPLLRKMADQQLLTGQHVEQEVRPELTVFTLTDSGRADLMAWLEEPIEPMPARTTLFQRYVVLALVRPERVGVFLLSQQRRWLEYLGALVADRDKHATSEELASLVLREATILHVEADLKWLQWLQSLDAMTAMTAADEPGGASE